MDEENKTGGQVEVVVESEGPKPLFTDEELSNIRVFKLVNGEDIIACIQAFNQHILIVRRPCKIVRIVNNDGTATVVLLKWQLFSSEETHVIQMDAIVSYTKITPDVLEFYIHSVEKQIAEETTKEEESTQGNEWPEWMDQTLDKSKIN